MTYTKPEINLLGDAARVIQFTGQKQLDGVTDPTPPFAPINPAYDLDE